MARAAPLPHATVPVGRHGVEVHLIKVFCVGQLAVRSELPERENEPEVLHVALVVNIPKVPVVEVHVRRVASFDLVVGIALPPGSLNGRPRQEVGVGGRAARCANPREGHEADRILAVRLVVVVQVFPDLPDDGVSVVLVRAVVLQRRHA